MGFVQVFAGVDQVARSLHGLRAAYGRQDGGHRVGMGHDVFAGIEHRTGQQRLGKSACTRQSIGLGRQAVGRGGDQCRRCAGALLVLALHQALL